jgi:hypothetical protein
MIGGVLVLPVMMSTDDVSVEGLRVGMRVGGGEDKEGRQDAAGAGKTGGGLHLRQHRLHLRQIVAGAVWKREGIVAVAVVVAVVVVIGNGPGAGMMRIVEKEEGEVTVIVEDKEFAYLSYSHRCSVLQ